MKLNMRLLQVWMSRNRLLSAVTLVFGLAAGSSLVIIARAWSAVPLPANWLTQLAVFVGTATLPQLLIEPMAIIAERLAPELEDQVITRWFRNMGAFLGLVERPLMLGSIIGGHAEFVGVWLVFKGIAGYRLGLKKPELVERRLFTLFLLNNAMSLSGVALGWLAWTLLALPSR